MKRAYYSSNINEFIHKSEYEIFGEITSNDQFSAEDLQKNTWKKEIEILKRELSNFLDGHLLFEYTIPRIGNRIDNVVLYKGIVFLLEFKVGESTYIEAAQALYSGHNVEDISRNDASAKNLNQTTKAINEIIDYSKANNKKSICFITGVPGAGKTLAGLNIAIERQKVDEDEHAVFLSGNGPLVDVLQEALCRDDVKRNGIKKTVAMRKAKEFIQIIHHFRDDAISVDTPPAERVTIFDEAQRAWDELNLSDFMKRKKGVLDFNMSEPEFLISILNRHKGWATIICLIGGGQEINKLYKSIA